MAIKLKKDGILQTNFLTRREEKTGNVKVVISPNKFQVGLSSDETFQQGMCVYGQSQFFQGLSGSLTQLTDGSSYLIAGSNVTITTGSNGSITISTTGGSGSPGGSDTEVQFNDAGAFGGDSDFTYDKTLNELTLSGTLKQLTGSFYSTNYAGNVNLRAPFDLATELNFTLPEADGTKFQFMQTDSAGNLSFDFSDRVYFNVRNQSGADLQAGTPVYVIGYSAGNDRAIVAASSASVPATMPAVGILAQNLSNNSNGKAVAIGILEGVNTVSFSEGDSLYVGDGVLQNTKPTGFNDLIQNAAFVLESATNGTLNVKSPGRTNDVPNIVTALGGFSGSLTTLTDGTSYLIAGTSIGISSQSNGPVTISATNVTASYVSSSVIEGGTVGEILAVNGSGVSEFTHNIVDATNTISLATLARYAYDGTGTISLDWGSRQLQYPNGSNASDWSTNNLLQVTGTADISGSLEVFTEESAIIVNAVGGSTDGRHIYIDAGGFNVPTVTNRSAGTKIVLYPALGATTIDYGIGVENRNVWFTTERATSTYGFKWYGAATRVAELDGSSTFFLQEKASITHLPDAGQGAFWVKSDTPNVPYFTDDTGTDYQLAYVGAGVSDFFDSTTAGSIFTTGSAAFRGLESGVDSPLDKGTDNFFYVSGSTNSKDTATAGTSLFGGDVVASGTTYFMSSTYIADVAGAGLTTPPQGTNFSPLLVEINNSGLEYAAHFKNESESVGSAVSLGFSNRSGVYNIKGGIAYQSIGTFGRGDIHILQNSTADSTDATLSDKIATFYNAGGGEVYGDWKTVSLSGSLTHLDDGSSYLVAGTNVTIVSNSNGSVTISSTASGGGGGSGFFDSTTAGSIFTTGSTAIRGGESAIDSPSDKGTDVFFYVSGSEGSKDSATAGTALFGGDVVVSGTLYGSIFVERQPTAIVSGTVQHYGWAVNKQKLINVQLYNYVTASQGSYDFTLSKDPDGTPVNLLQTSSYDLKTLTERTPTAVTLTSTDADLILEPGDVWRAQFEATSALIDAEGVYFLLNWELI